MNRRFFSKTHLAAVVRYVFLLVIIYSCKKHDDPPVVPPITPPTPVGVPLEQIADTYAAIANPSLAFQWGPYNVHDPSIIREGEYYYSYSTDVAFGFPVRLGLQIRRSKDLVEWEFIGWVFSSLPSKGAAFIRANGGDPFAALWAPYVVKVGDTFRLYYSLSCSQLRTSVIGLATSDSPTGPWTEQDIVVGSKTDGPLQTNAIDPTVLIDKEGNHWMYYGSAFDGIYIMRLDPATGLAQTIGDKGTRVSQRGFTDNQINGNIEGAEIIYNADLDKFYLFISYDWLETKYNVRVGRADHPDGPFLDYNGVDLNEAVDHTPMIIAPYRFGNHLGWQGTGHCSVFAGLPNRYYIAHQGRPAENFFFMILHVREIFWTADGWPAVSPERYAGIENEPVTGADVEGAWDRIVLNYTVVPGFSAEQKSPDIQVSQAMTLDGTGSINNDENNHWEFEYPNLTLTWSDGTIETVNVHRGRDWENKIKSTILFTGMDQEGKAVWGRKAQ